MLAVTVMVTTPVSASEPDHPSILGTSTSVDAPRLTPGTSHDDALPELSMEEKDRLGGDPLVSAYWTSDRLTNATPVETPVLDADEVQAVADMLDDAPVSPEATSPGEPPSAPAPGTLTPPPVTNWPIANGKIFFYDATTQEDKVCSGSVVNSSSKRLVATAGHCVHGGVGRTWHQNLIFIPSFHDGEAPYGQFQAARLRTFTDWINEGPSPRGFNSDVAFATMHANADGDLPVRRVGGHGLTTGGTLASFEGQIFGYPVNLSEGNRMYACSRTTGIRANGPYRFNSVSACQFGGGASGGPWLLNFSNDTGRGNLRSVNSFGPLSSVEYIAGPFFRGDVRTLWQNANADW